MTHKELRKLRHIPQDKELIQEDIADLIEQRDKCLGHSTVQASQACKPYAVHARAVRYINHEERYKALSADLAQKEAALRQILDEEQRLIDFIKHVSDLRDRKIFERYYIQRWTWQRIANEMGWRDEGTPRKKIQKYF